MKTVNCLVTLLVLIIVIVTFSYNLSIPLNLPVIIDITVELQSWLKSVGVSSIFIMKPDKSTRSISPENPLVLLKWPWLEE